MQLTKELHNIKNDLMEQVAMSLADKELQTPHDIKLTLSVQISPTHELDIKKFWKKVEE